MHDPFWLSFSEDETVENADWVELSTLFRDDRTISQEDLSRAINQARDIPEERARQLAADTFKELEDRARVCAGARSSSVSAYPFELLRANTVLRWRRPRSRRTRAGAVYLFLLAVARADMSTRGRILGGLDPTRIFERLCGNILLSFWAPISPHADVMVLGTGQHRAVRRSFSNDIDSLCGGLNEGGGWKPAARSPGGGDAGLDLAVWHRFSDGRHGALVGFAQCKTGTHWRQNLPKLRPGALCGIYMRDRLVLEPLRLFMVPFRINLQRWREDTEQGGLLLDRCRITQHAVGISRQNLDECLTWLSAFLRKQGKAIRRRRLP